MPVPTYGAGPLAKSFLLCRGLSLAAMIAIVGVTANFVSEIVSTNINPPKEVVATLAITSIAALYCLLSLPFFYARANLGLWIMAGIDSALCLSFVIISITFGTPVSFLDCAVIADVTSAANTQSAVIFAQSLASSPSTDLAGNTLALTNWAASSRVNCYETKSIWGLCVALCILFACSALILPTLFFKARKAEKCSKSVV